MKWLPALSDDEMNEEQTKTFERALTKFGIEGEAPAWLRVLANSPAYLKDMFMNVDRAILKDGSLSTKTKLILAATAAAHAGNGDLASYFAERAIAAGFTQAEVYEAVGISATSTSFNHYYKFRSLAKDPGFEGFNAGLRASLFTKPTLGHGFAELVNLMASAANGCASCVSGHITTAATHDINKAQIDEAIRVSAIVQSICAFLASSTYRA